MSKDAALLLDEAIEHVQKKAGGCETACGIDHAQLAKWLRELRDFRDYRDVVNRVLYGHREAPM